MTQAKSNETWFGPLFRLAGYGLLALSVLDIIDTFVPPRFTQPTWELQLVSNLVERVPVPLLGLVLVLVGEQSFRIFKFLSWACFVVGLLFLLLVPLAASSAWRIEQQNSQQITNQINQQTAQIQQLQNVLNQAKTPEQINNIVARLNPRARPPQGANPQELKSRLLAELAQGEKRIKQEAQASQASRRLALTKSAVKLILGALISGIVFLVIWRKSSKVLKTSRPKSVRDQSVTQIE